MEAPVSDPFRIVVPLFEGVTHLDFTGPHQVFSRLPRTESVVASKGGVDIEADGLTFTGLADLSAIETCNLLCVPGGFGTTGAMMDEVFMADIRRLAASARYITSVCTGSLILGAAGLLNGKRAACHWQWRDLLPLFGAIPDPARVARDGNIITGGGVTAGIDFALVVAAELAGEEVAQMIQLGLEYAPAPPFNSGRPETAPPGLAEKLEQRMAALAPSRREAAQAAAARL